MGWPSFGLEFETHFRQQQQQQRSNVRITEMFPKKKKKKNLKETKHELIAATCRVHSSCLCSIFGQCLI